MPLWDPRAGKWNGTQPRRAYARTRRGGAGGGGEGGGRARGRQDGSGTRNGDIGDEKERGKGKRGDRRAKEQRDARRALTGG